MTLDRLLREAGDHVDGLIDRHLAATADRAVTTTPTNEREHDLMTIVEQPPRTGEPTTRPPRRWALVAAAAAAVLLVVGIVAVQRDDEDEPADIPAPTSLTRATSVENNLIGRLAFDGKDLWSVRTGSTFLLRMHAGTGETLETLSLPEAAAPGLPVVHDGTLYVPSAHGVVPVNLATRRVEQPKAVGDSEIWSVAFATDSVWMVRRLSNSESLERWTPDLSELTLSVDLGPEDSATIAAVGTSVYLATAHDGLRRYDSSGTLRATIPGIGFAAQMAVGEDGTLWVADFFSGDLVAVDTATDTVRSTVSISSDDVMSVVVTPSSVWVTAPADQRLVVVDPVNGTVTATAATQAWAESLVLANGAAWVSGEDGWAQRFVPG
jgi:hypothetical protein